MPSRDFARATGRLAKKTDRIDALVLARFAEAVHPTPRPVPDEEKPGRWERSWPAVARRSWGCSPPRRTAIGRGLHEAGAQANRGARAVAGEGA